jgi:hypothetical protein
MKKVYLTLAGICALLSSFSQSSTDSSAYKNRQLKLDEINFISSYYHQNGDNSAVTGGIGTEKLTDIANVIDVSLYKYDKKLRKQTYTFELGVDHYTSASSDLIDLKANSSASASDNRIYPSITWSRENEAKGTTIGAGVSSSTEFDYQSFGGNINFSKKTKNKNGEFTAKFQTYLDQVKLVTPVELRTNYTGNSHGEQYGTSARNTFAGSLQYSQIVNQRLQVAFLLDGVLQQGYLSLPFHRVYFRDGTVHQENMPSTRLKLPLGFRANYFVGDKIIIRTYYRFYTDDWGITSNTANIEMPVKVTPFFSISPFYRFYNQTATKYFGAYETHTAAEQYYTSNYDLSKFTSNFYGVGFRIAPPKGVFGMEHFSMIELRYGHYDRSNNLNSDIVSLNLKFK